MTHEAYVWVSIVGLGGMTLVTRCALLMWPRPVQLPMRLQRALRFAPMAAIAGIVVPGVFFHQGVGGVELDPRTLAAAADPGLVDQSAYGHRHAVGVGHLCGGQTSGDAFPVSHESR